jgi:hypothetical protein
MPGPDPEAGAPARGPGMDTHRPPPTHGAALLDTGGEGSPSAAGEPAAAGATSEGATQPAAADPAHPPPAGPAARRSPGERVLPDITTDERDIGWGDPPEPSDDDRYLREVPPHHGS